MLIDNIPGFFPRDFMLMHGGIYIIECLATHCVYVGQTNHFLERYKYHERELRYQRHTNKPLQRDWDIHGAHAFAFTMPIAFRNVSLGHRFNQIGTEILTEMERAFYYKHAGNCYNIHVPHITGLGSMR